MDRSAAELIISLHEKGYVYDFLYFDIQQLLCIQENIYYRLSEVNIIHAYSIDMALNNSKMIISAIETTTGIRGLLISTHAPQYLKSSETKSSTPLSAAVSPQRFP